MSFFGGKKSSGAKRASSSASDVNNAPGDEGAPTGAETKPNGAPANRKRPRAFISASDALKQHAEDELDEFSDDNSSQEAAAAAAVTQSRNELQDDNVEEDCKMEARETTGERLARIRKRHNAIEFGMHRCILGHNLPLADRTEKDKEVDRLSAGTEYCEEQRHSSRLLHGKSGVNLLSHLVQRSCVSSTRNRGKLHRFAHAGKHWNPCPTVELSTSGTSTRVGGEVCAMAFDREGVLLVTGDDRGHVQIYDFDDVAQSDAEKRNDVCKERWQTWQDKMNVEPEEQTEGDGDEDKSKENAPAESGDDEVVVVERPSNDERDDPLAHLDAEEAEDNASDAEASCVKPALVRPVLSFQCRARPGGNVGPRISCVQWCPGNQDYVAVAFANQQEVHLYDVNSSAESPPCLRLAEAGHSRSEGVLASAFLPATRRSLPLQMLTGGNYGTVRLWSIPRPQKQQGIDGVSAKCVWNIAAFGSTGEGVCEMKTLPSASRGTAVAKPLVLLAGNASSLALLDTNRCTRKAFSNSATPTVAASWDLYHLAQREYAKVDPEAKFPARRWMAAHQLILLGHESVNGVPWYRVGLVVRCGWIFVVEFGAPSAGQAKRLRLRIVHHTPRIQCFNSMNERVSTLGGMALQFSLPDVPVPSATYGCSAQNTLVWLGDVKPRRYTMPSKDKYVLGQEHGAILFGAALPQSARAESSKALRNSGGGLALASFDKVLDASTAAGAQETCTDASICARLPLSQGTPLSLAAHPSGEWLIVGYGMNGRGAAARPLEVVSLRRAFCE
ncbi:hypothetical protein ACHAXT_011512 [Thalassiosira profunda]